MFVRFIFLIFVILSLSWSSLATSSTDLCPDVSTCAPENIVNQTCYQVCNVTPLASTICRPVTVPKKKTIGLIRLSLGPRGKCVNKVEIPDFTNCRGACKSEDLFNPSTRRHEPWSKCCRVAQYKSHRVLMSCEDGSRKYVQVHSPIKCACHNCEASWTPENSGISYPEPPHEVY